MRPLTPTLLLILLLVPLGARAQSRIPGRYAADHNGTRVVLTLRPDGTGDLMGSPGTWKTAAGSISLWDQEGQPVASGQVGRNQLVFSIEGSAITFRKTGAAARQKARPARAPRTQDQSAPAATKLGTPRFTFKALPGKRVKPKGSPVSFVVPKGWRHGWAQSGDEDYYQIVPPGARGKGTIGGTTRALGSWDVHASMPDLLRRAAKLLLGEKTYAQATEHLGPEVFRIGSHRAGRIIYRGQAPGGPELEGYLGAVQVGRFAYAFVGLYQASEKKVFRQGINTALLGFRGRAPKRNKAIERALVGCWSRIYSKNSVYASYRIYFAANGTYKRTSSIDVSTTNTRPGTENYSPGSAYASNDGSENGEYIVLGQAITFIPRGEDSYSNGLRKKGGLLKLGSKEWLTCS